MKLVAVICSHAATRALMRSETNVEPAVGCLIHPTGVGRVQASQAPPHQMEKTLLCAGGRCRLKTYPPQYVTIGSAPFLKILFAEAIEETIENTEGEKLCGHVVFITMCSLHKYVCIFRQSIDTEFNSLCPLCPSIFSLLPLSSPTFE